MSKKILILASANRDMMLVMDHMPGPGETFRGESYEYAFGGKGSNAAVATARQGADVTIATCLGDDANGKAMLESYKAEGMDTRAVRFTRDAQTGFALCTVERDGNSRIIVVAGANELIRFSEIPQDVLEEPFDALMTQFEVPYDEVVAACKWAAEKKIPVVIDAGPARDLPLEALCGVTIFSPNESEASILTGGMPVTTESECLSAAKVLFERVHPQYVVLKLGARGAYLYDGQKGELIPGFKVDAVDPTAAGDSFTSALMLEYLASGDIRKAIRYGHAAGALATLTIGAQNSLPTKSRIDAFLKENS